jgi:hypothetical protein
MAIYRGGLDGSIPSMVPAEAAGADAGPPRDHHQAVSK